MRKIVLFIFMSLLLSSCGDLAPDGAVVSGPGDSTDTLTRQASEPTQRTLIYRALDFIVKDGLEDDANLLADVEIEFFAGGNASLTDLSGNLLSNPSVLVTRTDDRGIGRVSAIITNPGCTGTTDSTITGSVRATVGTGSAVWVGTITVTCATETTTP